MPFDLCEHRGPGSIASRRRSDGGFDAAEEEAE
jgi:hypothetical protein